MTGPIPLYEDEEPPALRDQAAANLRYIRDAMASSTAFTAVSGRGGIAMGATALVAAVVASRTDSRGEWLTVWFIAAALAGAIGAVATHQKARIAGASLFAGPGRKFALGLAPPLLAGALLTAVLLRSDDSDLLAGVWLLLYG